MVREDEIVAALKNVDNIAQSVSDSNPDLGCFIVSKRSWESLDWDSPDTREFHLSLGADAET